MSFKKFFASLCAPSSSKSEGKTKAAPAAQPAKKQDDAAPAQKS